MFSDVEYIFIMINAPTRTTGFKLDPDEALLFDKLMTLPIGKDARRASSRRQLAVWLVRDALQQQGFDPDAVIEAGRVETTGKTE